MPPTAFAWEVQEESDRRTFICAKMVHKRDADAFGIMMRKANPRASYTVKQAPKRVVYPQKPGDWVAKRNKKRNG